MKSIKIYLAHSLTHAPDPFLHRMKMVRTALRSLSDVEVLDFAWEKGPEFNQRVNVYEYDMRCVYEADLVIAVLDYISSGTSMEIQARCQLLGAPLACFYQEGTRVSKIIGDCIRHYRGRLETHSREDTRKKAVCLPDPLAYTDDAQILQYAVRWMNDRRKILLAA